VAAATVLVWSTLFEEAMRYALASNRELMRLASAPTEPRAVLGRLYELAQDSLTRLAELPDRLESQLGITPAPRASRPRHGRAVS
jgi:hypothetical protein